MREIKICLTAAVVVAAAASSVFAQKAVVEVLESDIDLGSPLLGGSPVDPSVSSRSVNAVNSAIDTEVISSEVELPSQGKLKEQQVVEINYLIRQMIEQYEDLEQKRAGLDRELKFMRGQRRLDENRLNAITEEMRRVREQTEQVMGLNQRYSQQVIDLRLRMTDQEQQYQMRIKELEDRVDQGALIVAADPAVMPADMKQASAIDKVAVAARENTDLMAMIDNINQEGERLKRDTAKVHYNMGNIYFHKREYKKAVEEYKKTVGLVPTDAAAHFNLAFVSGEYLFDHKTAVKHYREYLLLSPDAPDIPAVKEKLLQAELSVRVTIDSPIDTPELRTPELRQ